MSARARSMFTLSLALSLTGCGTDTSGIGGEDVDAGSDADADETPTYGDGLPTNAVGWFATQACPLGWAPMDEATGRTILPTPTGGSMAVTVGAPLRTGESRTHAHAAKTKVDVPTQSFVAIGGSGNDGLANAGSLDVDVPLDEGSSQLPYVHLLACEKLSLAVPWAKAIPGGMTSFFRLPKCPDGWASLADSPGRMLVGLPDKGAPGTTFGGTPLQDQETRGHDHIVTGSLQTSAHGVTLLSGCCADGYAKNGAYPISVTSERSTVDLPYVQLAFCVKQ
jgi:hypothetical protein